MALIDRIGRFRGTPTQGIVGESTGGFPQFVVQFLATEYYDEATGEWIDWTPYQQTMTAYLILFNKSKALLNYDQVMKAFKWDGVDLAALQSNDFGDLEVQFDVRENVWEQKTSLRIEWVDAYDADPTAKGGDLTPMDIGKLKTIAAKYGQFMKTAPKAAPLRVATPAAPPVAQIPLPTPAATPPVAVAPVVVPEITQQDAWANLNIAVVGKGKSEDQVGEAFLSATDEVVQSSGREEVALTSEDWASVVNVATLALTA